MSESGPISATSTCTFAVEQETLAEREAWFKDGKAQGFKLFSIRPGSLYSKIGIQNGDIVQRINGYEMNSPDKALEIYQKLRDANRIEVELERRGETVRKTYSIE